MNKEILLQSKLDQIEQRIQDLISIMQLIQKDLGEVYNKYYQGLDVQTLISAQNNVFAEELYRNIYFIQGVDSVYQKLKPSIDKLKQAVYSQK